MHHNNHEFRKTTTKRYPLFLSPLLISSHSTYPNIHSNTSLGRLHDLYSPFTSTIHPPHRFPERTRNLHLPKLERMDSYVPFYQSPQYRNLRYRRNQHSMDHRIKTPNAHPRQTSPNHPTHYRDKLLPPPLSITVSTRWLPSIVIRALDTSLPSSISRSQWHGTLDTSSARR